jgi:hypothetical protein
LFQKRKRKEKAISFTFHHKFKETNEVLGKVFSKKISKNWTFPFLTVLPFYTFVYLCFYFSGNVIFLALLSVYLVCLFLSSANEIYLFLFISPSVLFVHLFCLSICSVCPTALSILLRITLLLNIDHGSLFRLFHSRHWPQKICKYYFILFCSVLFCFFDLISLYACQLQWPVWNIKNNFFFVFDKLESEDLLRSWIVVENAKKKSSPAAKKKENIYFDV